MDVHFFKMIQEDEANFPTVPSRRTIYIVREWLTDHLEKDDLHVQYS